MFSSVGPESLLVSVALLASLTYPQLGAKWFAAVERAWGAFACRRALSIWFCGVAALAIRAALLTILPVPEPFINDEIRHAIEGNICRCTGYQNIVDAVLAAAERIRVGGTT